ncbi:aspartokinase [Actinoplanes sp. N902-109]|uniref:amino acid kinase family protein n=1 Tax=Actinoplanes sp. (strain N902-109) TaxID=649831 RepID=UPI00032943D3|nr:aspartokinase [Actinoplanes sp. N902-109]AGL18132.1 Aspartokinase [Actinoplanes sp. N902-109]
MSVAVLKFGGSTFPDPDAFGAVADYLAKRVGEGERLVVTVSAGPGETERLRGRLHEVNPYPGESVVAGLLTLADTIGAHLLAAAVTRTGRSAIVLAGHQMGFTTSGSPMWARMERMDRGPLDAALADHDVVLLPGGQAVDGNGCPTWLGKNSSDLTAIAAAAALGVRSCEIFSDVEGVYTADPRLLPNARLVPEMSYDSVATLSGLGARVLHRRAVQMAQRHGVRIVCRLNRAPYHSGSIIGPAGVPTGAVVVNPNAVVVRFADDRTAGIGHAALQQGGIETLRMPDGPVVVVVNGYVDVPGFLHAHNLAGEVTGQVPVTEVLGTTTRVHLTADADAAVRLARELHDRVVGDSDAAEPVAAAPLTDAREVPAQ